MIGRTNSGFEFGLEIFRVDHNSTDLDLDRLEAHLQGGHFLVLIRTWTHDTQNFMFYKWFCWIHIQRVLICILRKLRLLDTYASKIAKIYDLKTFWPLI